MMHDVPPIYRYEDLKKLFKVSRSSLARWELTGDFPKRIQMGANSIGWRSDLVLKWLQDRSKTNQENK
jgi:predicted DNA-binding transcriptional regulator AlpA